MNPVRATTRAELAGEFHAASSPNARRVSLTIKSVRSISSVRLTSARLRRQPAWSAKLAKHRETFAFQGKCRAARRQFSRRSGYSIMAKDLQIFGSSPLRISVSWVKRYANHAPPLSADAPP